MDDLFALLDLLFDELVVTGNRASDVGSRSSAYESFGFDRASTITGSKVDSRARARAELRLRLALHLSPRDAIAYNPANPTPRWRLVHEHLVTVLGRERGNAETLARAIALLLDNWDRRRRSVTAHREALRQRGGASCAACHVSFIDPPVTLAMRDEYKPYFLAAEELLEPEVDHIDPISGTGTNSIENLQLLCRLCNAGKGDGLGIAVADEATHAGSAVGDVPRPHRARMLYAVIERDDFQCGVCGTSDIELTIRPRVDAGAYVRSNLFAVCVRCVE